MEYGRPGGVLRKVRCVGSKEVGGHGPQAASESDTISSSPPIARHNEPARPLLKYTSTPSSKGDHRFSRPIIHYPWIYCPCHRHQHPSFITQALVESGTG